MNEICKSSELVKLYSVVEMLKSCSGVKSPLMAIKSNTLSLAEIRKNADEQTSLSILHAWLISLNDFINCSRKMNPEQIKELAIYILQDYYYLTMADIYLVVTRIKKGYYGQLYESIDGTKILSFFEKYSDERANSIFKDELNSHDSVKYSDEKIRDNKIGNLPKKTK